MTLKEYAQNVGDDLRDAYNNKDKLAVDRVFEEADETLDQNNISQYSREGFWSNVHKAFSSGALLFEKQENSSLVALMRAIQQAITARGGK